MSSEHPAKGQPCRFETEKLMADYLLAAGTAGVGVLALAQPAGARIVYTPANIMIHNGVFLIDINHDGQDDLISDSTRIAQP